eukprot:754890-Hanusia_phi.AAC.4
MCLHVVRAWESGSESEEEGDRESKVVRNRVRYTERAFVKETMTAVRVTGRKKQQQQQTREILGYKADLQCEAEGRTWRCSISGRRGTPTPILSLGQQGGRILRNPSLVETPSLCYEHVSARANYTLPRLLFRLCLLRTRLICQ